MDNLVLAMGSLDKNHRGCHGYPARLRYIKSVQFTLETVSTLPWNSCPVSPGIRVQFALEYATEKKDGKIQFEIQKQSGSAIATAGERNG
jgi:hypothetical protein